MAFEAVEQICQGGFLILLILELYSSGAEDKLLMILDTLSIVCSFLGIHTRPHEASRYFLAFRTLKIRLLVKLIPPLEEELNNSLAALKVASNILLLLFCLVLIYSIMGLHCFGGSDHLR